ncbi:MarC family protein [Ancylobacter mangrovi]|uniref:MarC family protein n=1 Tax=Ancylobacter mangrovi TaxID=2972472 RepID=UPI002161D885|nr:MarC family protein [Ancylobacter mangrovi]MCS0501006.1 MarC family protein [Ancylobacter mangrovi]
MNLSEHLQEFVTLWVVIDPLGTLPVFIAVTATLDAANQRKAAFISIIVSFCVLVFFALAGSSLLRSMDVSINSFQIAGGIVLFLFALTMVHGSNHSDTHASAETNPVDIAIYPLAMPSIASPGAMLAAVVLTDDARHNFPDKMMTIVTFSLVLLVALAIMLAAGPLMRFIGRGGAAVISRVMGMLLAALAIDLVLSALSDWLKLPPI